MIGPGEYRSMLAGHAIPMARPGPDVRDIMPDDADRLEAALDSALVQSAIPAREGVCVTVHPQSAGGVRVSVPLEELRAWLGDDAYSSWPRDRWVWTKSEIGRLFGDEVMGRYLAGGWGDCDCWWDSRQERSITFIFAFGCPDCQTGLHGHRAADAMAGLGDLLGVCRGPLQDDAEYLESLRLAAAYLRFDLEATRREALGHGVD